jgi:hypothetical protein
MLQYQVMDVDKFFELYEIEEDQEDEIRERHDEGGKLFVRQDGTMFWQEEIEEQEDEAELMDEDDFRAEAEESGSVATLAGLEDDLEAAQYGSDSLR